MVQALVEIDENTNRTLNVVKAKYGLKDKGEAIKLVVSKYIEDQEDPELRPEFIEKMKKRRLESTIKINDFKKHFGMK